MTFADRLRNLRKKHDWTQEQVAKKLEIVRSTYAYYETGKTCPDFSTVVSLAHLFNVTTDFLLDADIAAEFSDGSQSDYETDVNKSIGNQWPLRESEQKLLIAYRYLDKSTQNDFFKKIEKIATERYEQRHGQQK